MRNQKTWVKVVIWLVVLTMVLSMVVAGISAALSFGEANRKTPLERRSKRETRACSSM